MTQTPLTLRRWERDEYERLVQLGMFRGEPIELIGGQLIVAEPQAAYHAGAITKVDYALRAILPSGWIVRVQAPVALDVESEPAPDLVVVLGHPGDYLQAHPGRPVLAVEVAESSLEFDRKQKGSLYAGGDRGLLDREPRRSRPRGVPRALAGYLRDVWVAVPIRHHADVPVRCRPLRLHVESDRRRRPPAVAGAAVVHPAGAR
jgi:Putative restriction endonuclease